MNKVEEAIRVTDSHLKDLRSDMAELKEAIDYTPTLKDKIKFYLTCWIPITRFTMKRYNDQLMMMTYTLLKIDEQLNELSKLVLKTYTKQESDVMYR